MNLDDLMDKVNLLSERVSRVFSKEQGFEGSTNKIIREANESLTIEYSHIKEILPYDYYDDENNLFINDKSIGFIYSVSPLTGADEGIVHNLSSMIKNKLPVGWDCQVSLFKHSMVGGRIAKLYEPFLKKGGMFADIAKMGIDYHLNATQSGYKNKRGYACRLSDYRIYLSFSCPKKSSEQTDYILKAREDLEAELAVLNLSYEAMNVESFASFVNAIISYVDLAPTFERITVDEIKPISHSIPKRGTTLVVDDNVIDSEVFDDEGHKQKSKIVNLLVKQWPDYFHLWRSADNYVNLMRPENGIQSSFLLTFNIRSLSHEKQKTIANRKAKSASQRNNSIYRRLDPGIEHEAADYDYVQQEMGKDTLTLCDTTLTLTLFSTPETFRKDMAKAIGSFRQNNIELMPAYGTQWVTFLSSLPFFMSNGLYRAMKQLDQVKPLTNWNAANLMPIVAEFKGSEEGVILPTLRNQLSAIDFHDTKNLPIINMNNAVKASSGAGKSYFINNVVLYELSKGNQVFIIDVGDSFKHLCSVFDGVYIEYEQLKLNPFTLFDFEGKSTVKNEQGELVEVDSAEQIRDLLALMASPDKALDEVEKTYLLDAVNKTWRKKASNSCIDDVIEELLYLLNNHHKGDQRLTDLITLLSKYASGGCYGELFNSRTPLFNNNKLVVLELGGLEKKPQLLQIVLYALIVVIQGQFYNTPRSVKKRCIIDEAWQFLGKGSNPIAAAFIEKGFRTARKHNAGFTVIGQKLDELKNSDTGRAIESCCDINIIMRQSNIDDYVAKYPNTFTDFEINMIKKFVEAKGNGFSEMLIKFGQAQSFHRLFNDPFSRILFSTDGEQFQEVENLVSQGLTMTEAVKEVALSHYGDEL